MLKSSYSDLILVSVFAFACCLEYCENFSLDDRCLFSQRQASGSGTHLHITIFIEGPRCKNYLIFLCNAQMLPAFSDKRVVVRRISWLFSKPKASNHFLLMLNTSFSESILLFDCYLKYWETWKTVACSLQKILHILTRMEWLKFLIPSLIETWRIAKTSVRKINECTPNRSPQVQGSFWVLLSYCYSNPSSQSWS